MPCRFQDSKQGPTGPFTLSLAFLASGALLAAARWSENVAPKDEKADGPKLSIKDAIDVVVRDKRILLVGNYICIYIYLYKICSLILFITHSTVGAVQALFEGAMYTFVLQWPPAVAQKILATFGSTANVPYGKVSWLILFRNSV